MKEVLFITSSNQPLEDTSYYVDMLSEKYQVEILNFKTKDSIDAENVTTWGFTDKTVHPYLQVVLNLLFYPRKDEIDIIFSSRKEWLYGVLNVLLSFFTRANSVVVFAGNMKTVHKYKLSKLNKLLTYTWNHWIMFPLLKHADAIITLSEAFKETLIELDYEEEKIWVGRVPDDFGAKAKQYEGNAQDLDLSGEKINAFFAGSLTKRKGMDTFLNILEDEEIRDKYHFILAGRDADGYGEHLQTFNNVTVLGRIPQEQVFAYYHCADLFVFPSHCEGLGAVNAEAYACGCPIVARDIVDLRLLADRVFETYEEFKRILKEESFQRKQSVEWPPEFRHENMVKAHFDAIESVLN